MTLTNFAIIPEPQPKRAIRRPLKMAADNLCRIKAEQLARELRAKAEAAGKSEAWNEGDEANG